jgi:predicted Fe-Mo cluster-binding NifX family protein
MKIAVSYSGKRIAPVFDVSENLLIIDSEKGYAEEPETVRIIESGISEKARRLSELGINVIICGAISGILESELRDKQIEVAAFVCGDVESVINALSRGNWDETSFLMPGCRGRRRRGGMKTGHGFGMFKKFVREKRGRRFR